MIVTQQLPYKPDESYQDTKSEARRGIFNKFDDKEQANRPTISRVRGVSEQDDKIQISKYFRNVMSSLPVYTFVICLCKHFSLNKVRDKIWRRKRNVLLVIFKESILYNFLGRLSRYPNPYLGKWLKYR